MTTINFIKERGVLRPSLPEDEEKLAKFKHGTIIQASIKKPRNGGHHRKFFALLRVVLDNTETFKNTDQILHIVKLRLGHFETLFEPNTGKQFLRPKSISFVNMTQGEFDAFYQQSVNVILEFMLSGWSRENLDEAYNQVLSF